MFKNILFIAVIGLSLNSWGRPVFGQKALVVSASQIASIAGIQTMKAGGNVVDGAVTTAFVLAVTRPYYASLGGGGFLLLRLNGKIEALDYRERAPLKSTREMYINNKDKNASTVGGLAVATPGNVRGLFELHKKYGKRQWRQNLQAAIDIAINGFEITEEFARLTGENYKNFSSSGKKYFSINGRQLQVGDLFKQPQLANALRIIQNKGADGFYTGVVADDIVKTVNAQRGIMSMEDLKKYSVRWMKPLMAKVFGVDVYSMPPPSSGGTILLSELKIAEKLKLDDITPYSLNEYHLLAEIMGHAFFDRQYIADPAFSKFDTAKLYSDERAAKWATSISMDKKSPVEKSAFEIQEVGNTTHYVVADKEGNAVSATTTVNTDYGSCVFTEKYGINLNNEMDDFTTKPGEPNAFGLTQSELNTVAPLKTPLSSMTPTIVEKKGKLILALGSPGGPRIINAVFQTLYHALHTKLNIDEIVQAPRVHHQYSPDKVFHDKFLNPEIISGLEKRGHTLSAGSTAKIYMIRLNDDGSLEGAFDARGEGGAAGN